MRLSGSQMKRIVALALTLSVASLLTFKSLAAPGVKDRSVDAIGWEWILGQELTGALSIKHGGVTVNGNSVQSGATILSASTISTDSNGDVIIDLGVLGRIELRGHTTVTLTFSPGMVNIKSECERTEIQVTTGQVNVTSPENEILLAGKKKTYRGNVDASTAGATDFIVDCKGRKPVALWLGLGLAGSLGLALGIAKGVATGSSTGDGTGSSSGGSNNPPPTTPTQP
jgi:hypothetical protein